MKILNRAIRLASIVILSSVFISSNLHAENLFMARTQQSFPEAMLKLQETILSLGYKISRVQRIDIGLTKSGFATDKYRIVFFGKQNEVADISKKYPHLIPYIPWKIAIFAEQQDTLLLTANPMLFSNKDFPGADKYLRKWNRDLKKIMDDLRASE
ncbi:MAG: hypothetical protein QM484_12975 [Woeseiaceae bacterium]